MACREMGFPNATAVNHGMRFRNVTGTIHQYDVNCTGIENGLPSCQRIETVEGECTGTHGEGVVLLCAPRGNPEFNDNSLNYNSLDQGAGRWFTNPVGMANLNCYHHLDCFHYTSTLVCMVIWRVGIVAHLETSKVKL